MQSKILLGVLIVILGVNLLIVAGEPPVMKSRSSIGADIESWMRIFNAVCVSPGIRDETTANQFYKCYGLLSHEDQCLFEECQKEVFEVLLNSLQMIQTACMNSKSDSLNMYIGCLMRKFSKAGRNYNNAAFVVNVCDGEVLGLE